MSNSKKTLTTLIEILNDGAFHSGCDLGIHLGITRSGVWKVIQKLQNLGVKVQAIKNKGYRLVEPLILLDKEKIKSLVPHIKLHLCASIDSTNDYLKKIKAMPHPQFCLAEHQMHGRGRFNRQWHSPFGKNIYLSCLYPFQKDLSELAGLSLLTSLAVLKTLKLLKIKDLNVKWSNDILWRGKKLAGNLVEVQAEAHTLSQAIIGIGINVNMLEAEMLTQEWASLQLIKKINWDRNLICAHLIQQLLDYLEKFKKYGFKAFLTEWQKADYLYGKTIALMNLNNKITGKVMGINAQGHLLVKGADGKTEAFSSGETSVLKNHLFLK